MPPKCKCTDAHCQDRHKCYLNSPSSAIIKTSLIPNSGKGLFADRDYKRGEFITYYSGTVSNTAIEGDRVLQINKKSWIDGAGSCAHQLAPGDFINHKLPANTRFAISSHPLSLACIKATKSVKAGDEFYINYGREYWESA